MFARVDVSACACMRAYGSSMGLRAWLLQEREKKGSVFAGLLKSTENMAEAYKKKLNPIVGMCHSEDVRVVERADGNTCVTAPVSVA